MRVKRDERVGLDGDERGEQQTSCGRLWRSAASRSYLDAPVLHWLIVLMLSLELDASLNVLSSNFKCAREIWPPTYRT